MNELQIFNNPEFGEIRTINESGTVLFCGSDVARALGYTNTSKALTDHCKGDLTKRYPITDTLGRSQEAIFIPESDLYRLIFRSKLPSAERFTDWVTAEVLPSIRKNGGYIAQQETLSPEELMAKALKLKSGAGWIYLENPDYCTIQGVAAKPAEPDPADVLAQEIAGKVKGSGLDPEDVLNRVEKILGVA